MRLNEIESKFLVVYPGRFQPFHIGHRKVYDSLVKKFRSSPVFIATSNKVELPKSPFSFEEKKLMMLATGVPNQAIVQCRVPYQPVEITEKYDAEKTVLVFAVSQKDMEEDPRFSFKPKKDGSPSYLQPFSGQEEYQPFSKHGYVIVSETFPFTVAGKPATGATQIRDLYANADGETRMKIISDLYGKFDQDIYNLMNEKLGAQNG